MMTLLLDMLTTACMLFTVASGLLVVFGVLKIINFAHGAVLTIGGYAGLAITSLGLSPWLSWPLAFLLGGLTGLLTEIFVIRLLYNRPLDAILATWGLGIVLGQIITLCFGREVQFVTSPIAGTVNVFGESYSIYRLLFVAVAVFVGVGFTLLLDFTRLGLSARAVIMNDDLAMGLGIDTNRVRLVTFSIGSALAALAGALLTPLSSVDPNMGVPWLINAFMLVMVAGSSFAGLALSATVLGGMQVVVSSFFSPVLGGITIVLFAAIILRIRPRGFALA